MKFLFNGCRINIPVNITYQIFLLYVFWTIFCCWLPWAEDRLPAIGYALLPLLLFPFFPKKEIKYELKDFALGVTIGSSILILVVTAHVGFLGLSSRSNGLTQIGPNTVGFIAAFGLFSAWYLTNIANGFVVKILFKAEIVLFSMVVFLTFSKTIIVGLLFTIIVRYVAHINIKAIIQGMIILFVVAVLSFLGHDIIVRHINEYMLEKYTFSTLTGRTLLWKQILDDMDWLRLLIGSGYNSSVFVSKVAGSKVLNSIGFGQAHNALIEAIINTGIFGATLLYTAIVCSLTRMLCIIKNNVTFSIPSKLFVLSLFLLLLSRSITEGTYAQPGTIDSVLLFYLMGIIFFMPKQVKRVSDDTVQ
ncbi:MAG: O-antigen ligase family protein [Desulfopila sp.]